MTTDARGHRLNPPESRRKFWASRKLLFGRARFEATGCLPDKLRATKNNDEFFNSMKKG